MPHKLIARLLNVRQPIKKFCSGPEVNPRQRLNFICITRTSDQIQFGSFLADAIELNILGFKSGSGLQAVVFGTSSEIGPTRQTINNR